MPGLLVLDGGDQPGDNPILLWGQAQIPNHKYWQDAKARAQSGGQSMVCVTNPLTREFILLPPIPNRRVHGKMAKLVFHNMARTKYHLVIAGWDMKKKNKKVEDVLCVIVYSSEKQCFVHANYIERARPIPYHECGRSGLAVINYCVYFGGMRVIERIDQNDDIYVPAIYYFNISHNRRQCLCFDFTLVNMAGRQVQPPKVVQAGPDRVFAVTRYAQIPTIIWIVEVNLQPDGTPAGTYKKVPRGVMPSVYYQKLFPTEEEALLPYECTNADSKITFKVHSERNLIVMYDMNLYEWRICEYPAQNGQKEFQLCDGCYEPVFTARPWSYGIDINDNKCTVNKSQGNFFDIHGELHFLAQFEWAFHPKYYTWQPNKWIELKSMIDYLVPHTKIQAIPSMEPWLISSLQHTWHCERGER